MEYFIIKDGKIAENFKNMLIKKLNEGIRVRIIYDGFGSFFLKTSFLNELRNAGAEIVAFSPPLPSLFNLSFNHRNHRKIFIVDGKEGIIGGSNIGDEYFGKRTQLGKWKDTDILITGESALCLQAIFLRDWYLAKGVAITDPVYFPIQDITGSIPIQIVGGGPDSPRDEIERIYISLIHAAQEQLFFVTPYMVPPEPIVKALENSVLRGVDVRIIIPENSDNIVAEYATKMYSKKFSRMGIRMYKHMAGFIHGKTVIIDRDVAVVGTANFDYRGQRLDYEIVAVIYSREVTNTLITHFMEDLERSQELKYRQTDRFIDRFGEGIIKRIEGIL